MCFLLMCIPITTVASANQRDDFLVSLLDNYGVFDGHEGIIYTDVIEYSEKQVLNVIYIDDNIIHCKLFSEVDNTKIDEISFAYSGTDGYILSVANISNGETCIIADVDKDRQVYVFSGNKFKRMYDAAVYNEQVIMEVYDAGVICHTNPAIFYDFINLEKMKKIQLSGFINCKDTFNNGELSKILELLDATADVVSFDVDNYDYSGLIKNILYTSEKYESMIDIPRDYKMEKIQFDYENISSVSAEYVDEILVKYFGIEPKHLGVSNMTNNNFCYVNGRYYYEGEYTGYFKTEVTDVIALYNLGGGRFYILFSDIYREDSMVIPEISYAVVDKNKTGYKLLKLSMGKYILGDEDIIRYSNKNNSSIFCDRDGDPILYEKERTYMINVLVGVCIFAISVALTVVLLGIVLRKK